MKHTRGARTLGVTALSAALLFAGVACSSDDKSEPTTTTTTAAKSQKSFDIKTEDGQVSLSLDGQLPPGWPKDFPVPDGAEPAGSGSLGNTSKTVMIGVFTASGEPSDAYSFYTTEADLDVDSQTSVGSGERYIGMVKFSGDWSGRITILPSDDGALIVVKLDVSDDSDDDTTATTTAGDDTSDTTVKSDDRD